MSVLDQAIFLSYASQDANAARRICETLRAAGLTVWFDETGLRGGDTWDASIRKRISECALFVPIISANTVARSEGYFRLEWKLAVDRSHLMADDKTFLLPVVIDDTEEASARTPDRFRERQWSRLISGEALAAFAERVQQLLSDDDVPAVPDKPQRAGPAISRSATEPADALRSTSIAVLPFLNLSRDAENEYFADGLTEELLNVLAKSHGLKVASRTSAFSFKGKSIDVPAIGRKLGVKTILEGSVRRMANRVRVTVQLVDVASDSHLWSETYDRELQDIFALQDEIAGMVAVKLQVSLGVSREKQRQQSGTANLAAYDHFLRGRALQWQRGRAVIRANEHFRIAATIDPNYADALAWMADSQRLMAVFGICKPLEALSYAKAAATRALDLAPDLAEGHATLAHVSLFLDHDADAALSRWRRAIEIEPGNVRARCEYAIWGLSAVAGDEGEAARQTGLAIDSDPLNAWAWSLHALIAAIAGRTVESLAASQHAVALGRESFVPQWSSLECLLGAGRHQEVLDRKADTLELFVRHPWMLVLMACAHAAAGEKREAKLLYDELAARATMEYVQPATLAGIAASAGLDAEAIEWCALAVQQRDPMLVWSRVLPSWSTLRRIGPYKALFVQPGFRE